MKVERIRYLGDCVYCAWDGYHVWLSLDPTFDSGAIALEPSVLAMLDQYREDVAK